MTDIAPLVKDCGTGMVPGRRKVHINPPGWTVRLIRNLKRVGIEATTKMPKFLFYAVQKNLCDGPPKPVIQSHCVNY